MKLSSLLLLLFPVWLAAQTNLMTPVIVGPKADDSAPGEITLRELRANGANRVGFKAPTSLAADLIWQFPATDGSAGKCWAWTAPDTIDWQNCAGGGVTLPVVDTTAIVYGSGDVTKLMRFEADTNIPTGTTVVLTVPGQSVTIMGRENPETITGQKVFTATTYTAVVAPLSNLAYGLGTPSLYWTDVYASTGYISNFYPLAGVFVAHGNWDPGGHITYDLGASSLRWKKLWVQDVDVSGTCTGCGGGGVTLPVVDTTSIAKGSLDDTKQVRFEVDTNVPTGTTVALTVPAQGVTIMGREIAETITGDKTLSAADLLTAAANTNQLGDGAAPFYGVWAKVISGEEIHIVEPASSHGTFWRWRLQSATTAWFQDPGANVVMAIESAPTRNIGLEGTTWPMVNAAYDLGYASYRWKDGYFSGTVYGNASTATAFAANPTDCLSSAYYAYASDASGNLTCAVLPAAGVTSVAADTWPNGVVVSPTTGNVKVRLATDQAITFYSLSIPTASGSTLTVSSTNADAIDVHYGGVNARHLIAQQAGSMVLSSGGYYVGNVYSYLQVIDSSRNILNVGSITTSGTIYPSGGVYSTGAGLGGTGHNTFYGGTWYYGMTGVISVRKGDDSGACQIYVYGGIITAHTC